MRSLIAAVLTALALGSVLLVLTPAANADPCAHVRQRQGPDKCPVQLYSKTLQVVIIGPNGTATDGVYLSCDAGDRFVRVEDVKASPKLISYSVTPLAIISDAIVR